MYVVNSYFFFNKLSLCFSTFNEEKAPTTLKLNKSIKIQIGTVENYAAHFFKTVN